MLNLLITLFYGLFAAFAAIASGRHSRLLGATMFWSWLMSNLAYYFIPLEQRLIINVMLDAMVFGAARTIWLKYQSSVHYGVMLLSIMSCVATMTFAWFSFVTGPLAGAAATDAGYRYGLTLNLLFAAQCLCVGGWGIADALVNAPYHRIRHLRARLGLPTARDEHAGYRRKVG